MLLFISVSLNGNIVKAVFYAFNSVSMKMYLLRFYTFRRCSGRPLRGCSMDSFIEYFDPF